MLSPEVSQECSLLLQGALGLNHQGLVLSVGVNVGFGERMNQATANGLLNASSRPVSLSCGLWVLCFIYLLFCNSGVKLPLSEIRAKRTLTILQTQA